MGLQVKQSEGGFDPLPEGTHHGVCYGVVDLGIQQPSNPQFKPSRKVMLMWEIPEERFTSRDGEDKPRFTSREFPLSLGSPQRPTKFRTFLETWRGKKFTDEELAGFELKNLLGVNCLLTVVHAKSNAGSTYANVEGVSSLPKGMPKRPNELDQIFFSFDDIAADEALVFPIGLPEWVMNKIKKSAEYVARTTDPSGAEAVNDLDHDDPIPF